MATTFSNLNPRAVLNWRRKSTSPCRSVTTTENSKLDGTNEKRKKITYEKDYFMQMLKNIENEAHTTRSYSRSNLNLGHTLHGNKTEQPCYSENENIASQDRRHINRQGLVLQTSEDMVGVVDKIIEKNKDKRSNLSYSYVNSTKKDAGEMINFLLNKTRPKSYHERARQNLTSPVRSNVVSNAPTPRDPLVDHRFALNNIKNNTFKERLSR